MSACIRSSSCRCWSSRRRRGRGYRCCGGRGWRRTTRGRSCCRARWGDACGGSLRGRCGCHRRPRRRLRWRGRRLGRRSCSGRGGRSRYGSCGWGGSRGSLRWWSRRSSRGGSTISWGCGLRGLGRRLSGYWLRRRRLGLRGRSRLRRRCRRRCCCSSCCCGGRRCSSARSVNHSERVVEYEIRRCIGVRSCCLLGQEKRLHELSNTGYAPRRELEYKVYQEYRKGQRVHACRPQLS